MRHLVDSAVKLYRSNLPKNTMVELFFGLPRRSKKLGSGSIKKNLKNSNYNTKK
jgi:hypothetical protein